MVLFTHMEDKMIVSVTCIIAAVGKLKQLNNRRIMKVVLLAWRESAEQSAKTNKWFKVCQMYVAKQY